MFKYFIECIKCSWLLENNYWKSYKKYSTCSSRHCFNCNTPILIEIESVCEWSVCLSAWKRLKTFFRRVRNMEELDVFTSCECRRSPFLAGRKSKRSTRVRSCNRKSEICRSFFYIALWLRSDLSRIDRALDKFKIKFIRFRMELVQPPIGTDRWLFESNWRKRSLCESPVRW